MIVFSAEVDDAADDKGVTGIGLSHENLKGLKAGQAIVIRLPSIRLLIFAGETEDSLAEAMQEFKKKGACAPL